MYSVDGRTLNGENRFSVAFRYVLEFQIHFTRGLRLEINDVIITMLPYRKRIRQVDSRIVMVNKLSNEIL